MAIRIDIVFIMTAKTSLIIKGKITGDAHIAYLIGYDSPKVFRNALVGTLMNEKKKFIGVKGKPGAFRRKLMKKKLAGGRKGRHGESGWSSGIIGNITGWVEQKPTIAGTYLDMGVLGERKIHKIIEFLGRGGSITKGSGELIIPHYRNLMSVGIKIKTLVSAGKYLMDYERITGRKTFRMRMGGQSRYYDEQLAAEGKFQQALMFTGMHRITIKKQFDFVKDWKRREPKAIERMQKAVDKASKRIQRKM